MKPEPPSSAGPEAPGGSLPPVINDSNRAPEPPAAGPSGWKRAMKILLRVMLGIVIAVLLLFGVCLAIFYRG